MGSRCRSPLLPAVVLASAACTGPPGTDPGSPAASYVRAGEWGEGDSALLEGVLRLQNGCVAVESERGRVVPVFPTDFVWDEGEETLSGLDEEVVVDSGVALVGGETSPASVDHLPEACGDAELFMVHGIEDATPS